MTASGGNSYCSGNLVNVPVIPYIEPIAGNRFRKRRRLRDQSSSRLQGGDWSRGSQSNIGPPSTIAERDLGVPHMSPVVPAGRPADSKAVPWTRRFRKSPPATTPSPEQLRRQNSVLQCAWRTLGASGPVIAFLNTHNEQLGGLPLHLALENDEGLRRVESLLGEISQEMAER